MYRKISLSVHQMVDFLLRKGDIDDRIFNNETMEEGSEIHRNYQQKQGPSYLSEVDLKTTIIYQDYEINLHGRADGIILGDKVTVDEIKSTNDRIEDFNEKNEAWHLGQVECYAYMYCKANNIKEISISLTYISQINHKVLKKIFEYNYNMLESKINDYIERYFDFYSLVQNKIYEKNKSIKKLVFPFSLRKGQSQIIKYSEDSVLNKDFRFLQASTGLGKTISVIFGVLKGSAKVSTDKIFFLAAKNSGFQSASDTLNILRDSGLKISSIELLAKEKMCLNKKHNCNPDDCPFARDYYDKRNRVLLSCIVDRYDFSSDYIIKIGQENFMCPFELSLDLSLLVDFIIMDYNYLFNPISYLRRFFDVPESTYNNYLIVDEAHNLVDRSRDMYSASISLLNFKKAKNSFKDIKSKPLKNIISKLSEDFSLFNKFEMDNNYVLLEKLDDDFVEHLKRYQDIFRKYQKDHPKYKNMDCKDFGLEVFKFLTIFEYNDDCYRIFVKKIDDDFLINLFCVDASRYLYSLLSKLNGGIFFSGTLLPIDYYEKALFGTSTFNSLSVESPFNKKNLMVLYNKNISIRFKDREKTIKDVIDCINTFISSKIGNYIVYTPSFVYLKMVENIYKNKDINVIYQTDEMSNSDKINFLKQFKNNPKKTTLGFCVLGGSFSEGIDLVDDRLIGIIVIGVGLPSISFENNLISDYYDNNGLNGFTFAYTNPGINKVMQAVGRLIRSETDRGIALLIDDRYSHSNYNELFKDIWQNNKKISSLSNIKTEIDSFYKVEDKV